MKNVDSEVKPKEKHFKKFFENLPIGLFRTTPDGKIVACNKAFLDIIGVSEDENLSLDEIAKFNSYSRDEFKERIMANGKITGLISRTDKRDGTFSYIKENVVSVKNSSGEIIYYEGSLEDITESLLDKEIIRSEKEKAQKYLDIVGVIIVAFDVNQIVTLINRKGCKVLGYAEKDIIGKNWFDHFLPIEGKEEVKKVFDLLIK